MEYPIRINKYLRDQGLASRREADRLIADGKVLINGKLAKEGTMINDGDKVVLRQRQEKKRVYLAYYKPIGLATQDLSSSESVITKWKEKGLFPVGRLDKESEGLLILTNDGRLTTKLIGEDSDIEKEYIVRTKEGIREGIPAILKKGMQTKTFGRLLPVKAEIIDRNTMRVILREGKRHQIRVMFGELGYVITGLKRVRIGHIKLDNLRSGQTRELTQVEVDKFLA